MPLSDLLHLLSTNNSRNCVIRENNLHPNKMIECRFPPFQHYFSHITEKDQLFQHVLPFTFPDIVIELYWPRKTSKITSF